MTGCVYLVHHPASGAYKIGQSRNPSARLKQLAPSFVGLALDHIIATENADWLESFLHRAFSHRHIKGEWFRLGEGDVQLIRAILTADSEADLPLAIVVLWERNRTLPRVGGRGQPAKPQGERSKVLTVRLPEKVVEWLSSMGTSRTSIKNIVMAAYTGRPLM